MNSILFGAKKTSRLWSFAILFKTIAPGIFVFLTAVVFLPSSPALALNKAAVLNIESQKGMIVFKVKNALLKNILKELNDKFKVVITGMEERENEKVTYSAQTASLADLLKGFLQHLGVKNFALEYNSELLSRVAIFPEAKGTAEIPYTPIGEKSEEAEKSQKVKAIAVQGVVDGTQAEESGIRAGDLIMQYDGVKLQRAPDLVKLTRTKPPDETVELILMRDGQPVRLTLKGGYIGVRIKTISVSPTDIEVK